jgi:hypothetical protein
MLFGGDLGIRSAWEMQLFMSGILLGIVFLGIALSYLCLRAFLSKWFLPRFFVKVARIYLIIQCIAILSMLVIVVLWSRQFEVSSVWRYFQIIIEALSEEWLILAPIGVSMVLWYLIGVNAKPQVVVKDA